MSYPWLHDTSLHLDLHVLFQDKATSRQMTVLYYEVVDDRRGGNGGQTVEVDDEGTRACLLSRVGTKGATTAASFNSLPAWRRPDGSRVGGTEDVRERGDRRAGGCMGARGGQVDFVQR
jgi:hypothetical protein